MFYGHRRARLFIGIDSGLLYITAAERTPAIRLWESTSSQFFYVEHFRNFFVVSDVVCQGCCHRLSI